MDRSEIIPMPEDYTLESQGSECLSQLQELEYSEQITVLRELVEGMGAEPSIAT
jgi:hypothetical protein